MCKHGTNGFQVNLNCPCRFLNVNVINLAQLDILRTIGQIINKLNEAYLDL